VVPRNPVLTVLTVGTRVTLLSGATLAAALSLALTLALARTGSTTGGLTHGTNGDLGGAHVRGNFADEVCHLRRVGTYRLRTHLNVGPTQQLIGLTALLGKDDGDDVSRGACASGTARTVQVGLVLGRRVNVDHEFDVVDVNSTRRDVRRDEHAVRVALEQSEVTVTLALREVAVQVNGGDSRFVELLGKLLRLVLGAHKKDTPTLARREGEDDLTLRVDPVDVKDVVRHRLDVAVLVVHRVSDRVAEELTHELVDAVVQRG